MLCGYCRRSVLRLSPENPPTILVRALACFRRYDQIAPFGVDALFVADALIDVDVLVDLDALIYVGVLIDVDALVDIDALLDADALLAAVESGRSLYQY